jgi:hypothetical protein
MVSVTIALIRSLPPDYLSTTEVNFMVKCLLNKERRNIAIKAIPILYPKLLLKIALGQRGAIPHNQHSYGKGFAHHDQ